MNLASCYGFYNTSVKEFNKCAATRTSANTVLLFVCDGRPQDLALVVEYVEFLSDLAGLLRAGLNEAGAPVPLRLDCFVQLRELSQPALQFRIFSTRDLTRIIADPR